MQVKELAIDARMDESTIYALESGRSRKPYESTVDLLARALKVSRGVLTGDEPLPGGVVIQPSIHAELVKAKAPKQPESPAPTEPPEEPKRRMVMRNIVRCYGIDFIRETPFSMSAQPAAIQLFNKEMKKGVWFKVELTVEAVRYG
jgi:transcriptional regulator with XRE-family HTH domain